MNRLNQWFSKWSHTSYAPLVLFVVAFADASFIPMPVVILFITLSLTKNPERYIFVVAATLGTLAGAIGGWSIGHFLWLDKDSEFTRLALYVFDHVPGLSPDLYEEIRILYEKWDTLILGSAVLTPIPFKYFTISAGVFNMNLVAFLFVSMISQGLRFLGLAILIQKYGVRIKTLIYEYFKPVAILLTASIIITIIIIKIF
jgi:membrane protein YqaA with SNARE-associated domain